MLEVTELAVQNLKTYMSENNIDSPIRVALMQGGWAGPSLGLALDEPKSNDTNYEQGGITFLVDNDLTSNCGTIKIDYYDAGYRSGFSVTSAKPVAGAGGGCGSSCGTGGSCGC